MKKLLLLFCCLLLAQTVCFAKIGKQVDSFDGSYCYYVDDYYRADNGQIHIDTTFNLVFSDGDTVGAPNIILNYACYDDDYSPPYSIDQTIKMRIDDTIFTWDSNSTSTRGNNSVELVTSLPSNVLKSLMETKKDIAVRFTYHTLSGHYRKDYSIPYKTIQEVQEMYRTYYNNNSSTNQAAS